MDLIIEQEILSGLRQPEIEQAVRALYMQYFESILTQICVNGGSRDDGADIFQESVLILIDKVKRGQFRGESSIKTFLQAIARNLWLHELRTRSRRNNREQHYVDNSVEMEIQAQSFTDQVNTSALEMVMEKVGDPCRKILRGIYYENKSMKELLLDFNYENEQVLRNRKSRCMKKLKELIANDIGLLRSLKSHLIYER